MDSLGNLYVTKGKVGVGYPTLACHLDLVQKIHSDDFEVRQKGDKRYGWSEKNRQCEGLDYHNPSVFDSIGAVKS